MNGKIAFGTDYLQLMRFLQLVETEIPKINPLSESMAVIFLHGWGFSWDEMDKSNDLYIEKMDNQELGNPSDALERIAKHISNDEEKARSLVVEAAAIASMDSNLSEGEIALLRGFGEALDLRPSEISELVKQGINLGGLFKSFGDNYSSL